MSGHKISSRINGEINPEYWKVWYQENKERISRRHTEYSRNEGYGVYRLATWRKKRISIDTYGQFLTILAMAGYRCEICEVELTERTAHLDHNHAHGQVRGVLCKKCNRVLGFFGDSVEGLMRAIRFLEES